MNGITPGYFDETLDGSQKLLNENCELRKTVELQAAQIAELEAEKMLVVHTVIKTLASVGLWPLKKDDNLAKKAMKGIRNVLSDAVLDSNNLAKRFSFLEEVYPLCEKYKDIEL